ncbi:MAG: family 16 glycoside hydrolase, partial [Pirellulaceae bacterium]
MISSILVFVATWSLVAPALVQSKFTDAQKIIRGGRTNGADAAQGAAGSAAKAVTGAKAVAAKGPPLLLSKEELAAGWISLFDGETLFGWKAHSEADWKVADGAIVVTSGKPGLLCTTVEFDNYVLKADFRAAKGTNSGIFLRTAQIPAMQDIKTKCYELNIAPLDNPFPTGSLVGRQVYAKAGETDKWRTFEATVDGPKVVIKIDGQEVLSYEDPKPSPRGYIGLQLNSGKCEFKNIKLQPLGLKSIFNGQDLTGWKEPAGSLSKFTVTKDGELNVKNGKGTLESDAQFGDFVLQLECIS